MADDGPGISTESRDDVLEAGFTTAEAGTGLGFAIVGSIAAAHDWSVAVTGSGSDGARFEITMATSAQNGCGRPANRDDPAG